MANLGKALDGRGWVKSVHQRQLGPSLPVMLRGVCRPRYQSRWVKLKAKTMAWKGKNYATSA